MLEVNPVTEELDIYARASHVWQLRPDLGHPQL